MKQEKEDAQSVVGKPTGTTGKESNSGSHSFPSSSGHAVGNGGAERKPAKCISYRLPFPLSVNNLFFNTKRGRVKTTRYQKWLLEVGALLKAQGIIKIEGHVSLRILIIKPDRRRRDLDNYLKALIDALVLNGVMEDDSLIEKIVISWHSDNLGGCFVEVRSHEVCEGADPEGVAEMEERSIRGDIKL